tara:strand:- start:3 stop:1028 length:1026 start_codon:yes stop_codon:yes gene_type:complete
MSIQTKRQTETIPEWKTQEVEEIKKWISNHSSVGICDVTGIPSRQFQQMRASLRGDVSIKVSRNTLVKRAVENVDGLDLMEENLKGQVGIVCTDKNPFTLYQMLKGSKTPAPINAGDVATKQIVIPEGDTGFPPGPFVGDLQAVGAAAQIAEGSIRVTASSVVAEIGDVISPQLSNVLGALGIEPKEVGLNLKAVYSEGVVYDVQSLDIDTEEYKTNIIMAMKNAMSLSMGSGYPVAQTISTMLSNGFRNAKSLGIAASVESPDLAVDLINRAASDLQALSMSLEVDARPEKLKSAVKSESIEKKEQNIEQENPKDVESSESKNKEEEEAASAAGLGDLFG